MASDLRFPAMSTIFSQGVIILIALALWEFFIKDFVTGFFGPRVTT